MLDVWKFVPFRKFNGTKTWKQSGDGTPQILLFFLKFRLRCWKMHFICSKKENVWAQKMRFLPQKEASTKHYREHKDTVDGRNPAAVDR